MLLSFISKLEPGNKQHINISTTTSINLCTTLILMKNFKLLYFIKFYYI